MQEKPKIVGEGVKFERIRRITGYLVGSVDRFNNAKRAEVEDRVTHVRFTVFSGAPHDSGAARRSGPGVRTHTEETSA